MILYGVLELNFMTTSRNQDVLEINGKEMPKGGLLCWTDCLEGWVIWDFARTIRE